MEPWYHGTKEALFWGKNTPEAACTQEHPTCMPHRQPAPAHAHRQPAPAHADRLHGTMVPWYHGSKTTVWVTNRILVARVGLKLGQNESYGLQEPF